MALILGLLYEFSQLPASLRRRLLVKRKGLFNKKREPGNSKLSENEAVPSHLTFYLCGLLVLLGLLPALISIHLLMTKGGPSQPLHWLVLSAKGLQQGVTAWASKASYLCLVQFPWNHRHGSEGSHGMIPLSHSHTHKISDFCDFSFSYCVIIIFWIFCHWEANGQR